MDTTENSISRFLDFNIFGGRNLPQETPRGSRLWRSQYFPLLRNIRISTNTPSQTPATRLNDIAQKNNIQIGYYNRDKILRIFRLIDQILPEVNTGRKRMIGVNFILKQLFEILGKEYKFIPLTWSKNTLKYYSQWWQRIYALIKDDI